MMTRKENLMAIYHHQSHDHIASFLDFASVGGDAEEFENGPRNGTGGQDWFGMEWRRNAAGSGGGTPAPGKIILPDGGTTLEKGDRAVVVTTDRNILNLDDILAG